MTTLIYDGIGARATPGPVLADMTKMAAWLARTGWNLAAGGARGGGHCVRRWNARGTGGMPEIPCKRFGGHFRFPASAR